MKICNNRNNTPNSQQKSLSEYDEIKQDIKRVAITLRVGISPKSGDGISEF